MMQNLKQEINNQLSRLANGIQVSSCSYLCWGEPEFYVFSDWINTKKEKANIYILQDMEEKR